MLRTVWLVGLLGLGACTSDTFVGDDAATEGGSDAVSEGATDGGDGGDGGVTCGPGAPAKCSGQTCSTSDECCVTSSEAQCRSLGNSCLGDMLQCLGPDDCTTLGDGGTPLCCLTGAVVATGCPAMVTGGNAQCVPKDLCGGAGGVRLCHSDLDCPKQTCTRALFNDNASFVFGICE